VQPAVFLDRDNTLIVNDGDLGDPHAVTLKPGVGGGLRRLREAGYRLVIVTNQGGVARGVFTEEDVDAVHQRIAALVDETAGAPDLIDRFYFCPYHPEAVLADYRRDHPWRKPNPGMLLQAADDMDLDLAVCWMVGDQARDVTAGRMAGCRTVLVNDDSAIRTRAHATAAVSSFEEAVDVILERNGRADAGEPGNPRPAPPADLPVPDTAPASAPPGAAASPTPPATLAAARPAPANPAAHTNGELHRALAELTEELRQQRSGGFDFSGLRLAAGLLQLLAVLLAVLGILQWSDTEIYVKWMVAALVVQGGTLGLLLLDIKR